MSNAHVARFSRGARLFSPRLEVLVERRREREQDDDDDDLLDVVFELDAESVLDGGAKKVTARIMLKTQRKPPTTL